MRRNRKVAWGTFATVGGFAVLATVLWKTSDLGQASSDLEHQLAAARREGVPIEYDAVRRLTPPLDDANNAAIPYARAFNSIQVQGNFKGIKIDELMRQIADGTAKPADVAKLKGALTAMGPALAQVEEGSRRRGMWFNRQWERGSSLLFPEYAYAKSAGRALVLRAMLAKDPKAAAHDLETVARLSTHVGSEPLAIATLVGSALENNVHFGLRTLASRGGPWPDAMRPVLDALGPVPDLHRTLTGESVFCRKIVEEVQRIGPSGFGYSSGDMPAALRLVGFKPARDAFEARIVEHWRKVWAALPQNPLDWRGTREAVSLQVPSGLSYALADIVTPVFSGISDLPTKTETDRRLTRAALDLWAGKTPTLAKDPFGAGPLRLQKESGGGWTLWSLGPDGLDQKGKVRAKPSDPMYDIVVKSSDPNPKGSLGIR